MVKTDLGKDKKSVEVTIKDTGCGILKEVANQVANPIFTIKSPHSGMGLGLSIAHRIVSDHNGRIEVDSERGACTTFRIIFPVHDGKAQNINR